MDYPITDYQKKFTERLVFEKTRAPVENAITLSPELYRRRDLYELELDRVFSHGWIAVGYTCQVDQPGKMLTATVAGQPIVITTDQEGVLRGYYNVCRHRGSLIVTKDGQYSRFRCPYHSWTYDLQGKLIHCPLFVPEEKNQSNFNRDDFNLIEIKVAAFGCFIFVNLDDKAESLENYLLDFTSSYKNFPLEEMILVRRKKYTVNANWKLVAENFLEYYHLPWVHPELCEVAAIDMHRRNQGRGMYMSFFASPLLKGNTPLDHDFLPAMPGLSSKERESGYFPMVFPNLALFLMPHHIFALIINPLSVNRTEEFGDILVHKSLLEHPDVDDKIDKIWRFYDMVNMQDIVAVNRVQEGLKVNAYPGGRMSYRFEEPVHRFQNMVIDFFTKERRHYPGDGQSTC